MNLLGIDFEDWYHPELVQRHLGKEKKDPLVINGIDKILDWLRSNETFATFFTVGELLEFKPELLDKILADGHEIGFHTMYHTSLDTPGYKEKFKDELKTFEALTSGKSKGFRAPTFTLNSTTAWAIDDLAANNYLYDSSIVPAKTNMYGMPNAQTNPYHITSSILERNDPSGKIIEFPLLVTRFLGRRIPAGGGFYLRTLPMNVTERAIENYEKKGMPAAFYIHSWELTPEFMPKISLPVKDNFVTFHNIKKAMPRMDKILKKFKFTSFSRYMTDMKTLD